MPEEEVTDVEEVDSSTAQDVNTESSTEELAEPTADQGAQDSEQRVPFDRFKEVNDQLNYYKGQVDTLSRQQQPVTPTQEYDPDANLPPETKVFYQDLEKRFEKVADRKFAEKEQVYKQTIDNLTIQNARIQEKLFREENRDVVPGSQEEQEIAKYISLGLPPDKAAMAVMGNRRIDAVKSGKTQQQKVKTSQKAQANVETSGIPSNSGIPTGEKLSFRDDLEKRFRAAGL